MNMLQNTGATEQKFWRYNFMVINYINTLTTKEDWLKMDSFSFTGLCSSSHLMKLLFNWKQQVLGSFNK